MNLSLSPLFLAAMANAFSSFRRSSTIDACDGGMGEETSSRGGVIFRGGGGGARRRAGSSGLEAGGRAGTDSSKQTV